MNLLKKRRRRALLSFCTVFIWLGGQQAYAYLSNTLGYEGSGQAFPAEIETGALAEDAASEQMIVTASSNEIDLAECYGDEVEISLRSKVSEDGTVLARTVFLLPNPSGWLVSGNRLETLSCRTEPIIASSLWGGFMDPRLGHGQFGVPGVEGVRVRSIRLSTIGTKAAEDSEAFWGQTISSEGVEVNDGFVHRVAESPFPIDGGWLFPEAYLSPIGSRIRMTCVSPTCEVHYLLEQNLNFSYEIWVGEDSRPMNWIAIDQYVRDVVFSWIEQN